jgi:cholesterol transport system auxiliary component
MNNYKSLFLLIIVCFVWSGCTLGPEKRDAPVVFDLGPQRLVTATVARINVTFLIPVASATPLLDSQNILYRLKYRAAGRPEAYLENRWAASPAIMITDRLRARFASATRGVITPQDGARADYALRVEIEDFSQWFDAPDTSIVTVRMRASLVNAETRALHAQHTFALERSAAPDAAGAAKTLSAVSDAVVEQVLQWAAQSVRQK